VHASVVDVVVPAEALGGRDREQEFAGARDLEARTSTQRRAREGE
jgi:hypothetical protein